MRRFVTEQPHIDVMSALAADLATTAVTRWSALGRELPPRWTDARARISALS